MEEYVDLHVHTTASDGTKTPREIVEMAAEVGLKAVAITDHDAVDGIDQAIHTGAELGCEIIPGVELSATVDGVDMHLLGFYVDWTHRSLLEQLRYFRKVREERAAKIVQKLNQLGLHIRLEKVKEVAGDGAVGRPHIAEVMVQEHVVGSFNEAFSRYLGNKSPAYVPKFKISPKAGIEMIRSSGGIAVFAHPGTVRRDELIPSFIADGLQGLEVIHPDHSGATTQHYLELAKKYGLVTTGGSDFHGPNTNMSDLGGFCVPYAWVEKLKELRKEN